MPREGGLALVYIQSGEKIQCNQTPNKVHLLHNPGVVIAHSNLLVIKLLVRDL